MTSIQAREEAETLKIQAEEKLRSEEARIKMEEVIAIQEEITLAEGRKKASTLDAEAAIKQAEATRSREAAPGLTQTEVMEATAVAKEKDGLAEAAVLRERLEAQAIGDEKVGLGAVRVTEAEAD